MDGLILALLGLAFAWALYGQKEEARDKLREEARERRNWR